MSTDNQKLKNPPIVEAIIDIDCDMPPDFNLRNVESLINNIFKTEYPNLKKRYSFNGEIGFKVGESPTVKNGDAHIQAILMNNSAGNQLVQIRQNGFSFNRLTPYTSLDDYLPEVERVWKLFFENFSPLFVQRIGLRYVNRILLPLKNTTLDLDTYLKVGPKLPKDSHLEFAGFVHQQQLVESNTGNQANIVLATQSDNSEILPLIFDIGTTKEINLEPSKWDQIESVILSLRTLKNHIFFDSLTKECTCLFNQHQ